MGIYLIFSYADMECQLVDFPRRACRAKSKYSAYVQYQPPDNINFGFQSHDTFIPKHAGNNSARNDSRTLTIGRVWNEITNCKLSGNSFSLILEPQ